MASTSITATLRLYTALFKKDLKSVEKTWKQAGNTMRTVGRDMTVAVTAPLLLAAKAAVDTASSFDLAVARLKGLSGANASGLPRLVDQARELGSTTIFTATEIAELQLELKKLGKEAETIEQITPSVLNLAQAFGLDLAEAGQFVVQTMNRMSGTFDAFITESSAAEYAANATANALKLSALDMDSFRASLNYVGAEANVAGLTFSETAAILGQLANAGFTGSRAGTQLRRIFIELTKEGKDVSKEFFDIVKSGVSFEEALDRVGVRAAGTFAALAGGAEEMLQLEKAIRETDDTLGFFADQMDDTIFASLKKMESATQELAISVGEVMKPAIQNVTAAIASMTRYFAKLNPVIKSIIVGFLAIVAAIGPVIFYLGLYKTAVAAATLVSNGLAIAVRVLMVAMGGVGLILTVIAAGMALFSDEAPATTSAIASVTSEIDDLAKSGDKAAASVTAWQKYLNAIEQMGNQKSNTQSLADQLGDLEAAQKRLIDTGKIFFESQVQGGGAYTSTITVQKALNAEYQQQYDDLTNIIQKKKEEIQASKNQETAYRQLVTELNAYVGENNKLITSLQELRDNAFRGLLEDTSDTQAATRDLTKEYRSLSSQIENIQNNYSKGLIGEAKAVNDLTFLNEQLQEIESTMKLLGITIPGTEKEVEKSTLLGKKNVSDLRNRLIELQGILTVIQSRDVVDLDKLKEVKDEINTIQSYFRDLGIDLKDIEGSLENLEFINENELAKTQAIKDAIASINEETSLLTGKTTSQELAERWDRLRESLGLAKGEYEALEVAIAKFNERIKNNELARFQSESVAWGQSLVSVFSGFSSTLVDVLDGTKSFSDVMIDVLKKLAAQVIATALAFLALNILSGGGGIRAAAAAQALSAGGGFSGLLSGSLGGGAFGNYPTIDSSFLNDRSMSGVVAGSNLIIAETRGITAFDRTYG